MSPLSRAVARLLLAPLLVTAAAVLVKGYADVGDGFSAGVIAGLALILQDVVFGPGGGAPRPLAPRSTALLVFGGLLLALAVVFLPVLWGEPPVSHLPGPGAGVLHLGTLEVHTAVLFDLGVVLVVVGFTLGALERIGWARRERP